MHQKQQRKFCEHIQSSPLNQYQLSLSFTQRHRFQSVNISIFYDCYQCVAILDCFVLLDGQIDSEKKKNFLNGLSHAKPCHTYQPIIAQTQLYLE